MKLTEFSKQLIVFLLILSVIVVAVSLTYPLNASGRNEVYRPIRSGFNWWRTLVISVFSVCFASPLVFLLYLELRKANKE